MQSLKYIYILLLAPFVLLSCKKFVEIGPSRTSLLSETVFSEDNTALSVLAGTYSTMTTGFATGGLNGVNFMSAASSGEVRVLFNSIDYQQFGTHSLTPGSSVLGFGLWGGAYQSIYGANTVLEGLAASEKISAPVKRQLTGEASFIRAFSYFWLVNLFGDVPLCLTTDYRANAVMPRTPSAIIYQRIIDDLKIARDSLPEDYSFFGNERARPNKYAAAALLARVYLYTNDWKNAELQSGEVLASSLYKLVEPENVFLKNSREAIWQLGRLSGNAPDASVFFMTLTTNNPPSAPLTEALYNSFNNQDLRKQKWIASRTLATGTYRYTTKYKTRATTPVTEYAMVLRRAEQFLIRAEARARQQKLTGAGGAAGDLDSIRLRAGLLPTTATTAADLLTAIEQERIFELFTEGHRWGDIKRTGRVNEIMPGIDPAWKSYMQWYPIPQREILNNPALKDAQNDGY